MIRAMTLVILSTGGLLSGCSACGFGLSCPAPSSAYQQVEDLSGDEREAAAARLPLEQRLDVYHDVYIRSGHPRTMLTRAFDGTGEAGFNAVLGRMTDRFSFNEYFWIVHWMHLNGDLDICRPEYFDRLSEKARAFDRSDPRHPVPIRFGDCVLIR